MGTEKMSFDSKHVFSSVTEGDFNSGEDGDSKEEEPTSKAEENKTFGGYISGSSSALFSVSVLDSNFFIGLASVLTSFSKFLF